MIGREHVVTSIIILLLSGIVFYIYPPKIGTDVFVVDLDESADTIVNQTTISGDVVHFGFDLRLGPKTDIETYAPLMDYLSAKTGKQFKLKYA